MVRAKRSIERERERLVIEALCEFIFFLRQKADMPSPSFCQVERRFHSRELNRQPFPYVSFLLKGSQISALQFTQGLVRIQDVNPRIQNSNTNLRLNLCMSYMVHVSSTMWRIKNQSSNSTSCSSDNALHLLVLVAVFQDSKMSFQSMNSTPSPFRQLTLMKASSVSRLSLVLLSLLTQYSFEKSRSKNQIQELNRHLDIVEKY